MRSFKRCMKAVSPVIATIIIVAIAIVMAIAVAYWMLGLGSSFTKYEKIEFTSAYASKVSGNFIVYMDMKNTGSAAATIDNSTIFYNGKPSSAVEYTGYAPIANFGQIALNPGNSTSQQITLMGGSGSPWQSGMTVEIMIQTTAGKQYPKVISLP